jgi:Flp pilus assembly protein TadG
MSVPGWRPAGEEGSFTFAVLIWVLIFFALMTVVVDGSMEISAKEQAANVADSIARNVANDISVGQLRSNGKVVINSDGGLCDEDDISKILSALGASAANISVAPGDCRVNNGNSVTVTVTLAYTPLLWGSEVNARATATAAAVTAPIT